MTDSRPTASSGADEPPDESQSPLDDSMRAMRSEVNAYASAILLKLLGIVGNLPGGQRGEVQGLEREIRQMLAFINPAAAADLDEQPLGQASGETPGEIRQPELPVDQRIDALIRQVEQIDLQAGTSAAALHELRAAVDGLRDDLERQHDETTQALSTITATTRSLHYTITALAARSEQVTDATGIAEEQLRVGVWRYALIAGLSSGALVAAIIAFVSLAT